MRFNLFRSLSGSVDLARIIGAKASVVYPVVIGYTAYKAHTAVEPGSFGSGYLQVLTGIGILIGGKELAVAKAKETNAKAAATLAAAAPPPPE
jgi:hypothetical protein